jgi:hypothetical protein
VPAGREPGWAGHEPVRRQAEARQRGKRPGPSGGFRTTSLAASRVDDPVAGGRRDGAAIAGERPSGGHFNRRGRVFHGAAGQADDGVNSGAIASAGIHRRMQLCARFAGLPLGMAGLVVREPLAVASAAPAGAGGLRPAGGAWVAGMAPGGRDAAVAAILVFSPASCRGRHHPRASVLARAMLGTYSLDHAEQDWLGAAGPPFSPGGDSCRPATFWCGCASVCWRSCYPMLLGPKAWVPTVIQL